MAHEQGLFSTLGVLGMRGSERIKKLSMATAMHLQRHVAKPGPMSFGAMTVAAFGKAAPATAPAPSRQALREVDPNTPTNSSGSGAKGANIASGSSSGGTRRLNQARTVTLFVKGLTTEERRMEIESALLRVKGVISFLIDLGQQKVTIRSLTEADVLVNAIRGTTGLRVSTKELPLRASSSLTPKTPAGNGDAQLRKREEDNEVDEDDEDDDEDDDDSSISGSDDEGDENGPTYLDEDEEWNSKNVQNSKFAIVTESEAKASAAAGSGAAASGGWFGRISKALWG